VDSDLAMAAGFFNAAELQFACAGCWRAELFPRPSTALICAYD